MPFSLREDAEKWFSELDGKEPTKTKFDLYYFLPYRWALKRAKERCP